MIKSIELKNWKTHKHTKLDFSKGTNILIGQMGSGKSSIMDAISYALFGTFPSIQRRQVSVSRLVRNKPTQERDAYVKLAFSFDGNEYAVKRDVSVDGKATATIEKNGAYLQSQPQRVTEEIQRILKIDYDTFAKAIYSEQNGMDYFLNLSSSARKKQIDSLLGLDKFSVAQDNTTSLINKIKDMAIENDRIAGEFDIDKAKSDLEAINEEREKLKKEKEDTEEKLKDRSDAKSKAEARLNSLKEQHSRKIALAKGLEGAKSKIALLEAEIKKIDSQKLGDADEASKDLERLQKEREAVKKDEAEISEKERESNSTIARLEAEIKLAMNDIAEKEKLSKKISALNKSSIDAGISSCNAAIEQHTTTAADSKARISNAEAQIKELEKHISKCPICERDLDEHMKGKLLDEKRKAVSESRKSLTQSTAILDKKKAELRELNSQLAELALAEEKLKGYSGIEGKIEVAKKMLATAKGDYAQIKAEKEKNSKAATAVIEDLQRLKSIIESIERRKRYLGDKENAEEDLAKKLKEHDSIKVDQKELDKLQEEFVALSSEISTHKANLESAAKYIKDKEAQAKDKKAEIERINRIKEDAKKKREVVDNLAKFKISLLETQSLMRTQLINHINGIMHEVWQNLYPYGDYQGLMLNVSEDDYELKVKTLINNEYIWENVEAIASGGEKSTASLAMRIAFSLVLVPNLKWLILDEPTHNIDREGLSKFVQVFGETLPTIVDQVFIITHDEALKQVNNSRIYSFSRDKAENKETSVEEI